MVQIGGSEGLRQHLRHRQHPDRGVHEKPVPTELEQQLPAPSAGHDPLPQLVAAGEGHQPAAPGGVQLRDQPALGTEPHPIGGILHVATDHDTAVVHQCGRTHLVVGVGRVGPFRDLPRRGPQPLPVDAGHVSGSSRSERRRRRAGGEEAQCH